MPNYSQGKVYKIVSTHVPGVCCVGSTTQKHLSSRLAGHRSKHRKHLIGENAYITSFGIVKHSNAKIILLEECPCESKDQLLAVERKYIEALECLNKVVPLRSIKEYYQANKQAYIDKAKLWKEKNLEKVKQSHKTYREKNRTTINQKKREKRMEAKKISQLLINNNTSAT